MRVEMRWVSCPSMSWTCSNQMLDDKEVEKGVGCCQLSSKVPNDC